MNKKYDVIVVGAGMVGVSTALHLLANGQSVLLLDKSGIATETSYGNSGIIENSYVLPFAPPHWKHIPAITLGLHPYARLNYPSGLKSLPWVLQFYLQSRKSPRYQSGVSMRPLVENALSEHEWLLKGTSGVKHLSDYGRVKLHRSEQSFAAAQYERDIMTEYGVPYEALTARELIEIEPDIKPAFHKAIRFSGSKRYTNPAKAIQCAAEKFVSQGGDIKIEDVSTLEKHDSEWRVNTHASNHVVICAGPWSNALLEPLGHKFPFGNKRGYHRHYKSSANIKHALVDGDEGYLICPMEQGIRLTTGAEFADINAPQNPKQLTQILPKAKQIIDLDEPAEEGVWMGVRPCMPDSLPVIGQSNQHSGLWFNFGHGHCGITAGPASGRLLAEMLMTEATFCDPAPYRADRF